MARFVKLLLFVYAVGLIVGGAIGYAKKGSVPSLVAGTVFGLLAALCFFVSVRRPRTGFALAVVVAAAVGVERILFWQKAPPENPAKIALAVAVASFVMIGILLLGLAAPRRKPVL